MSPAGTVLTMKLHMYSKSSRWLDSNRNCQMASKWPSRNIILVSLSCRRPGPTDEPQVKYCTQLTWWWWLYYAYEILTWTSMEFGMHITGLWDRLSRETSSEKVHLSISDSLVLPDHHYICVQLIWGESEHFEFFASSAPWAGGISANATSEYVSFSLDILNHRHLFSFSIM